MASLGFWELAVGVSADLSEGLTNLAWELGALGVVAEERPGLGARTEEKILQSIGRMRAAGFEEEEPRVPVWKAMPIVRELTAGLAAVPSVERVEYCGALRRLRACPDSKQADTQSRSRLHPAG